MGGGSRAAARWGLRGCAARGAGAGAATGPGVLKAARCPNTCADTYNYTSPHTTHTTQHTNRPAAVPAARAGPVQAHVCGRRAAPAARRGRARRGGAGLCRLPLDAGHIPGRGATARGRALPCGRPHAPRAFQALSCGLWELCCSCCGMPIGVPLWRRSSLAKPRGGRINTPQGASSSLYKTIKSMAYSNPALLDGMLSRLADAMAEYMCYQIEAGAQVGVWGACAFAPAARRWVADLRHRSRPLGRPRPAGPLPRAAPASHALADLPPPLYSIPRARPAGRPGV